MLYPGNIRYAFLTFEPDIEPDTDKNRHIEFIYLAGQYIVSLLNIIKLKRINHRTFSRRENVFLFLSCGSLIHKVDQAIPDKLIPDPENGFTHRILIIGDMN